MNKENNHWKPRICFPRVMPKISVLFSKLLQLLDFPYNWDAKLPILLPPPKIPRLWHFVFQDLDCRSLRFMEILFCTGFRGVSFCCPELQRRNCTRNFSNTAKGIARILLFFLWFSFIPNSFTVLSLFFFFLFNSACLMVLGYLPPPTLEAVRIKTMWTPCFGGNHCPGFFPLSPACTSAHQA